MMKPRAGLSAQGRGSHFGSWHSIQLRAIKLPPYPVLLTTDHLLGTAQVSGNARLALSSPMAPLAAQLAEGEERTAFVCIAFVVVSLVLGVGFVATAIFFSPSGIAEKSLWGLIGALMGGISLMIRGLHREATISAYRWRGMVAAYGAPQVSKTTVQKLDAIIIEYLEREVRHGSRSRASAAS